MTTTETCWADPLSRAERRVLRGKLASACHRFYVAGSLPPGTYLPSLVRTSRDMADLHLDVTEHAEVPTS